MRKFFINLFLVCAVCQGAVAQIKNILLDPANAYEPSVAINRSDVQNIVASSATGDIYFTRNGGLSWEKSSVKSVYGSPINLFLLADFKGNFYCVYQAGNSKRSQVVMQQSGDGGKSWSEAALVSTDTSKYAVNPKSSIDRKGNLFVTWTDFDNYGSDKEGCISRVLLSKSSNGRKWTKPMELSETHGNCKDAELTPAGAMAAVMGGGERAFAVWANQEKILFDRAFDEGNTWLSSDITIAQQIGGWRLKVPGVQKPNGMPVFICNNTKKTDLSGALMVVWADQHNGGNDTDIWITRTLNFGDNWSQAGRINDDVPGKHQYLPTAALDSQTGNIYIIYYDRRNYTDTNTDVYLAFSKDGGASFENVKISETPFVADSTVATGNYIGIAAHAGVITPIWTRTENGKSSVLISVIKQEDLEKLK